MWNILKPDEPEPDRREEYPRSDDVFDNSAYLPQKIYAKKKAEEHKQEMEEKEPIDNKKEEPIEENWPEPEINQKEDTAKKNPVFLGSSYGSAAECWFCYCCCSHCSSSCAEKKRTKNISVDKPKE